MIRSEPMGYYMLVMSKDIAWDVINKIGYMDCLQFEDNQPNSIAQAKPFWRQVKRCDEIYLKIDMIIQTMQQYKKSFCQSTDYDQTLININQNLSAQNKIGFKYLDELDDEIQKISSAINNQITNLQLLMDENNQLILCMVVIQQNKQILERKLNFQQQDIQEEENLIIELNQITGVINEKDIKQFTRLIFRISKGNSLVYTQKIVFDNEFTKNSTFDQEMAIFIIVFSGGSKDIIKKRVYKACESFNAKIFDISKNDEINQQKVNQIKNKLQESQNIIKLTLNNISNLLDQLSYPQSLESNCSKIEEYRIYIQKEKSIYQALNNFKTDSTIYQCKCWCPKEQENYVVQTLQDISKQKKDLGGGQFQELDITKKDIPPTYFITNEFTAVFQQIVDTYGIPRYREFNPALFTCITFPFLFGVMFGDIFHGGLLFLFGIYLVFYNSDIKDPLINHPFKDFSMSRYFIILMGIFSIYCGFIYNDFAAIRIALFDSCYDMKKENINEDDTVNRINNTCVYTFGIDPVWGIASNNMAFLNSFKMKMSIIIGVIQMSTGIILKGANAIYFKQYLDFFFEFIPQIIFLWCFFGLILNILDTCVLKLFINGLFLFKKINIHPQLLIQPLICFQEWDGESLYNKETQENVQKALLALLLIMIPMMLLVKPIAIIYFPKRKARKQDYLIQTQKDQPDIDLMSNQSISYIEPDIKIFGGIEIFQNAQDDQDEHDHGEIIVHQIIETIEFVLGSISNTASYLRLWALSLAHGELSLVFYTKALHGFIDSDSGTVGKIIGIIIGYSIFFQITFGVIMCMDVMECILHSLRLHWVEFQNKFYKGDGRKFQPVSFKKQFLSQ